VAGAPPRRHPPRDTRSPRAPRAPVLGDVDARCKVGGHGGARQPALHRAGARARPRPHLPAPRPCRRQRPPPARQPHASSHTPPARDVRRCSALSSKSPPSVLEFVGLDFVVPEANSRDETERLTVAHTWSGGGSEEAGCQGCRGQARVWCGGGVLGPRAARRRGGERTAAAWPVKFAPEPAPGRLCAAQARAAGGCMGSQISDMAGSRAKPARCTRARGASRRARADSLRGGNGLSVC